MRKKLFLLTLIAGIFTSHAQSDFPKNYFRNPLKIPILLAGNYGECRPNHFHTGLDMKTNGRENLEVVAAADGYVSRMSISHSGYGNAIYITHPNGYTTVYAHLNDFFPELQKRLKEEQYRQEKWNLDFELSPNEFPVKKGEMIAYSGTTGGSTGPHLHFEVRDSKTGHVLNGGLFGFPIKDNIAPIPKSLAIYESDFIYSFPPKLIAINGKGSSYAPVPSAIRVNSPKVKIALRADDYMNGSSNTLGVYEMKLAMDGAVQCSWSLDDLDFDQNRYVNAFADYKLKEEKNVWYQSLFQMPGNKLEVYRDLNPAKGSLDISDGGKHEVQITLKDFEGNISELRFTLQMDQPGTPELSCGQQELRANKPNEIKTESFELSTDASAMYENLCCAYTIAKDKKYFSDIIQLQDNNIPLHSYATLKLKLTKVVPFALRNKLVFVHHIKPASLPGNNPQSGSPARYENGWAMASIRTFGNYYVDIDTVAPVLSPSFKGSDLSKLKHIEFKAEDKMTSVASFRAELDGRWLCFVRKGNRYIYTFDEHWTPGEHSLQVAVTDENGNTELKTYTLRR